MSTCPQVGSMLNEGIWNAQKKAWEGGIPRTREGDEAHYTAFLLGTLSVQAAGCHGGAVSSLLYATPPPPVEVGRRPLGGGGVGRVGWGGSQVGQFGVVVGGGGAQAPVTSPCPPSGVRARATVRARVRARVRVRVMGRVRCRVRSRLRVGVGVRVKVGFKYSVGVLHRLGGEGCYVGKGNEKKILGAFGATICMAGSY